MQVTIVYLIRFSSLIGGGLGGGGGTLTDDDSGINTIRYTTRECPLRIGGGVKSLVVCWATAEESCISLCVRPISLTVTWDAVASCLSPFYRLDRK